MNLKNLSVLFISAFFLILTSCKKDVVADESINGEVTASNLTANEVLETALPVHTPRQIAINSNVSGYYETLPARYNLTTKQYPLIIFIHGIVSWERVFQDLIAAVFLLTSAAEHFPLNFS